jgi:transposase
MPTIDEIIDALRDRKRTGGAAKKRKIGNDAAHAAFLRELLEEHDARLQLRELCLLFERRFDVRVSKSTMHRFVRRQLGFSRQRVQRQLPKQAVTAKNLDWRKSYVDEWFDGADLNCVGTNAEQHDQQRNWRLRVDNERNVTRVDQLFWIDETGCNRHTLLRTHGYAKRGNGGVRCAGCFDGQKGRNHSVIIAINASAGIVARQVLVGSNERRGTRRDDFCAFLRRHVAPAMLKSAAAAGIDRDAPLYLMMDNASIHRGAVVSHALRKVSRRLHVAYQPPYMPTVNPVELVNNHLKASLRSLSLHSSLAGTPLPTSSSRYAIAFLAFVKLGLIAAISSTVALATLTSLRDGSLMCRNIDHTSTPSRLEKRSLHSLGERRTANACPGVAA